MRLFFISFCSGVVVTYVGNFIAIYKNLDMRGPGAFIADAFYKALPNLMVIFWLITASALLFWFVTWLISSNKEIKDEAQKEADATLTKARLEAEAMSLDLQRGEKRLAEERKQQQAKYQQKADELEAKRQSYLQRINALQLKVEYYKTELVEARKGRIKKLREMGREKAAKRAEKELEKTLLEPG